MKVHTSIYKPTPHAKSRKMFVCVPDVDPTLIEWFLRMEDPVLEEALDDSAQVRTSTN